MSEGKIISLSEVRAARARQRLHEMEALATERKSSGLPVISIPAKYLTSSHMSVEEVAKYAEVARGLKLKLSRCPW